MSSAWLAIVGTLAGASLTFLFQRINASKTEEAARAERLRERRMAAYASFAEKLMEWRRTQVIRSSIPLQSVQVTTPEADAIKDENRRARAAAWIAFYQVKLVVDNSDLEMLGRSALDATRNMKSAKTRHDINAAGDEVRKRLEAFLKPASTQIVA